MDRFAPSVKCHWFSGGCHLRIARLCDKPDTSARGGKWRGATLSLSFPVRADGWQRPPPLRVRWDPGKKKKKMNAIKKWMSCNLWRKVNVRGFGWLATEWSQKNKIISFKCCQSRFERNTLSSTKLSFPSFKDYFCYLRARVNLHRSYQASAC